MTPIALKQPSGYTRLGGGTSLTNAKWRADMVDMIGRFVSGEDIYVRYIPKCWDKKRSGSIAKIKKITNLEVLVRGYPTTYGRPSAFHPPFDPKKVKPTDIKSDYVHGMCLELKWDGRTNKACPHFSELEWLKDYTGPTDWKYELPEVEKKTAYDRLEREIKVGDFICYVLHHFESSGASVRFGNVTKVQPDGVVWAKNIKLDNNERVGEKKINDNSTVVILTKDLMDQLMLAKLKSI